MEKLRIIGIVIVLSMFVVSCANMGQRKKCIVTGAAVGAAIGAGSGAAIGHQGDVDNKGEGSLVGAAAGAVIGGVVGYMVCPEVEGDADGDGVLDSADNCPNTPPGVKVDENGCPLDSDGDGVTDDQDKCPDTPKGVKVDETGCPLDSDGDGVTDDQDKCPDTPKGVKVDETGCPLDSDGDGVPDYQDKCPKTPTGAKVNEAGCWVLKGIQFDTNQSIIKSAMYSILDEVVGVLEKNPDLKVEIQGHTDNMGSADYNMKLSEMRASAVMDYIVKKGIEADRLSAKGYGLTVPIASNETPEGRAMNRRVQLNPVQ